MEQRLNHAFYQFQASTSQCISVEFFFTNLNMIFIVASYSLILFIGGYKVITGQLTIGSFTIINTYYNQIIQSLSYYLGFAGKIQDLKTSYARILKILKSEIELSGVHELHTLEHIKINNLSVASDSGIMLAPQTLEFHRGQIYGIKGVNGSGKTTFFNSLIGLYPADKTGTILYNGLPIEMLDMKLFRRNSVSYLEQETTLMNMSIQEYLQLGVSQDDETIQRQQRLIEYFDINKTLDLGKSINSDGGNLSGGERQKLSLIRSFSKKCDLYLLDEPTSALDSIRQAENRRLCGNCYCTKYSEYIFVNQIGELIKPDYITRHFKHMVQKYNLRKLRFHDLRHSCASLLFANGVSMKEIQAWLGHSTLATTANIYTHMDENQKITSAVAIMPLLESKTNLRGC